MTHNDLQFKPTEFGGWRAYVEFDNGYALSIVHGDGSWCDDDTVEVCVLYNNEIDYDGFGDPAGYQTSDDVDKLLKEYKDKKPKNKEE